MCRKELRIETDNTSRTIKGYGAIFNESTEIYDATGRGFREYIRPGAFAKSLEKIKDIRSLFNHDVNFLLGRTKSGTLRVSEDETGLYYEVDLPDSPIGNSVRASIERGDIDGSSFTFMPVKDKWSERDGIPTRELVEVDLFELGPVVFPAYDQTSVDLRSIQIAEPNDLWKYELALYAQEF